MRIAVIGGGPSGSRAAAGLAGLGHDVTLIDRSFDREKPCGGGVPAAGLRALFALPERASEAGGGAPSSGDARAKAAALAAGGFSTRRFALQAPSGACTLVELPGPLTIYSRRRLDGALLDAAIAAGARLVPEPLAEIARKGAGAWHLRLAGGTLVEAD